MYVPVLEYPNCIENLGSSLVSILTEEQIEYFKKYLTGLLTSVNKTITGINRIFVFDPRNQSSFNRFFTESNWDFIELNNHRLELLQKEKHTKKKVSGVVIIDDTHNEKYGDKFEKVFWLYDTNKGYYHWSHNLVTSHYSDEKTDYPLFFRAYEQMDIDLALSILDKAGIIYDKEKLQSYSPSIQRTKVRKLLEKNKVSHPFFDKNDIACQLIDQAFNCGFFYPVAIDSWYTTPKVVNHIESKSQDYVGEIKENRKILVENDWQSIGKWTQKLVNDHQNLKHKNYKKLFRETSFYFKGIKKSYWTFTKVVRISKLGRKRIVISYKDAELSGEAKFFVSNQKKWNANKILSIGRHRWPVEPFYEISKGFLGLESYELRDFIGVNKHWALVFFAYSLVKLQNPDCVMRSGDDIQTTFGDGLRAIQKEVLSALCAYCYESGKKNEPFNEVMKQLFPY